MISCAGISTAGGPFRTAHLIQAEEVLKFRRGFTPGRIHSREDSLLEGFTPGRIHSGGIHSGEDSFRGGFIQGRIHSGEDSFPGKLLFAQRWANGMIITCCRKYSQHRWHTPNQLAAEPKLLREYEWHDPRNSK